MNNIILNNGYGILGLLPNSNQKDISRRIKEIEKLSKIGEIPEYLYDFEFYDKNRNLQNIKMAEQSISSIEERILHHFF